MLGSIYAFPMPFARISVMLPPAFFLSWRMRSANSAASYGPPAKSLTRIGRTASPLRRPVEGQRQSERDRLAMPHAAAGFRLERMCEGMPQVQQGAPACLTLVFCDNRRLEANGIRYG